MTTATLMLHLTGTCNLECRHCYMEGSPRRRERLPSDWVVAALREAPGLGIGTVFLTGGEPLLHPDFDDIVATAAAVEGLATTVCTNATLINRKHAERFARSGLQVHVSIDGEPGFHDAFRGLDGAFRRAERGIGCLVQAGVPVTVTTTISRANFEQFDGIAQWTVEAGVTRLLVQPLLHLGRATDLAGQHLSTDQLNALILQTSDFAHRSHGRTTASIIGGSKRFFLAHPCAAYVCNGGGCHRGVAAEIKKVVVREDGNILPEATNLDHRYRIGHVDNGTLGAQIARYFPDGYAQFDRLCRAAYDELVPDWPDAILPWDQLLAHRSRQPLPSADAAAAAAAHGCGPVRQACGSPAHDHGQAHTTATTTANARAVIPITVDA